MQLNPNSKTGTAWAFLVSRIHFHLRPSPGHFAQLISSFTHFLHGFFSEHSSGSAGNDIDATSREEKRLAYEMKQALGIKGFVLNLTASPSLAAGFSSCWDAVRPCLETPELDDAVAQLRSDASRLAADWSDPTPRSSLQLNHDEALHLQVGLDFYHYLLPKMVVLTAGLRFACEQELVKRGMAAAQEPAGCSSSDDVLQSLFQRVREILSPAPVPGAARLARAWPGYLAAASRQLKPVVHGESYRRAATQLSKFVRQRAVGLKDRISLGEIDNLEELLPHLRRLETLLPSLMMSLTLLEVSFRPVDLMGTPNVSSTPRLASSPRSGSTERTPSRRMVSNPANPLLIAAKCFTSHQPQ